MHQICGQTAERALTQRWQLLVSVSICEVTVAAWRFHSEIRIRLHRLVGSQNVKVASSSVFAQVCWWVELRLDRFQSVPMSGLFGLLWRLNWFDIGALSSGWDAPELQSPSGIRSEPEILTLTAKGRNAHLMTGSLSGDDWQELWCSKSGRVMATDSGDRTGEGGGEAGTDGDRW